MSNRERANSHQVGAATVESTVAGASLVGVTALSAAMWTYGDRSCLPLSDLPTDRFKDTDHMDQLPVF